jgi:hypothetical protein
MTELRGAGLLLFPDSSAAQAVGGSYDELEIVRINVAALI